MTFPLIFRVHWATSGAIVLGGDHWGDPLLRVEEPPIPKDPRFTGGLLINSVQTNPSPSLSPLSPRVRPKYRNQPLHKNQQQKTTDSLLLSRALGLFFYVPPSIRGGTSIHLRCASNEPNPRDPQQPDAAGSTMRVLSRRRWRRPGGRHLVTGDPGPGSTGGQIPIAAGGAVLRDFGHLGVDRQVVPVEVLPEVARLGDKGQRGRSL